MRLSKAWIAAIITCWAGALAAQAPEFDKSFLTDYGKLQTRTAGTITDSFYASPDIFAKLKTYNGVAVDQPEVLISPESYYKGAKPDDLANVAEAMRVALTDRLTAGGYNVIAAPGPGVVYIRMALTDLKLKKKKRNLLAYTPVGADALRSIMDKYDITGVTLQSELTDSASGEVLAALVVPWQAGSKERMEFGDLEGMVGEYGARLRCQLDNAKAQPGQQVNCLDPKARAAREGAAKPN